MQIATVYDVDSPVNHFQTFEMTFVFLVPSHNQFAEIIVAHLTHQLDLCARAS